MPSYLEDTIKKLKIFGWKYLKTLALLVSILTAVVAAIIFLAGIAAFLTYLLGDIAGMLAFSILFISFLFTVFGLFDD